MKIEITRSANADLESIGSWLVERSGGTALAIVRNLRQACLALSDMPLRFPLIPGHEDSGIRRRVVGVYALFYVVEPEAVRVLRILHGARDYEALLFPRD